MFDLFRNLENRISHAWLKCKKYETFTSTDLVCYGKGSVDQYTAVPVDSAPFLNPGDEQHSHQLRLHDCNPTEKQGKYFIFTLVVYFFLVSFLPWLFIFSKELLLTNKIESSETQYMEKGLGKMKMDRQTVDT